MFLEFFFNSPTVQALGWSLLHFIWQGTLLALVLAFAQKLLQSYSANLRYMISSITLSLMLLVMLGSFFYSLEANRVNPKSSSLTLNWNDKDHALEEAYFSVNNLLNKQNTEVIQNVENQANNTSSLVDRASNFMPWIVCFWGIGIFFLTIRFSISYFLAKQLVKNAIKPLSLELEAHFSLLAQKLGITQQIKFYLSAKVEVPTVIGWIKPVILIPVSSLTGLSNEQLEAIVLHELAHIRRYDYLVNIFQTLIETLLFYHPAVWWVSSQIRIERENCCDDIAVEFNNNPLTYAKALITLEEIRQPQEIVMAANGGILMERIKRLLGVKPKNKNLLLSSFVSSLICLLLLVSSTLSMILPSNDIMLKRTNQENRTVAVGFVALPAIAKLRPEGESPLETTKLLIETLKKHQVPAIGFVQGQKLESPNKEELINSLRMWRDAGKDNFLELGIGTYSHKWFFGASYEDYIADIEKNENVVKPLLEEQNKQIRYFSYPFLNTGVDLATKERFQDFLKSRSYKFAPYTIDNDDWFFAKVYDEARVKGDQETMQKIKAEYIPYMENMFEFYENYSKEIFAREIPQVLLLTPSRLNADSFDDLVKMLKSRNYKFVTLDKATSDEAFQSRDNYTGKTGISWLQRWGITRGANWKEEPRPKGFMEQFNYHKGEGNLKAKKTN
jgi:beta-lactamase regulating signal transducer with metallopeptidase domain/peptidoglycan/xylan/chitin deacetylase (PgdA/CDA1 family)